MERLREFLRKGTSTLAMAGGSEDQEEGAESPATPLPISTSQLPPPTVASTTAVPHFSNTGTDVLLPDRSATEPISAKEQLEEVQAPAESADAPARATDAIPTYPGLPARFVLESKLGDGTFSVVYKALDTTTGEHVAVKVARIHADSKVRPEKLHATLREQNRAASRATILREVQLMRSLDHPGIVKLLSFTESDEYCFLVMELLDGGELFEQIVKLTYLSEPLARHVIVQVAEGVRYMHEERGAVHRDIKPENLLFESLDIIPTVGAVKRPYDADKMDEGVFRPGQGGGGIGRVKIADFGLSKVVWEQSTLTPCGTVGYAAPEIVRDEQYSRSVDMWALGCVLYTLLCGFPPFYDESVHALTKKVSKGQYTFLSPWWDDVSDAAKDLVTNLLTVDVNKRYTIDQMLAHEWCQQGAAPADAAAASSAGGAAPLSIPAKPRSPTHAGWHAWDEERSLRTADAHRLREAFDVSFAVHRIEEEMQHNLRIGAAAKREAAWHRMNTDADDASAAVDAARRRHGAAAARAIADRRRPPPGTPAGREQAAVTAKSFTLNMEGATILARRNQTGAKAATTEASTERATSPCAKESHYFPMSAA